MSNPYGSPASTILIIFYVTVGVLCLVLGVIFRSVVFVGIAMTQLGLAAAFLGGRVLPDFGPAGLSRGTRNLSWAWAHRGQPRPALFLVGFAMIALAFLGAIIVLIEIWA